MTPAQVSQAALAARLEQVLARLQAAAEGFEPLPSDPDAPDEGSALARLCARLALSPFEADVLVMGAGLELDSRVQSACDALGGATVGLALAAFEEADWCAFAPGAPLRSWRLVELAPAATTARAALRIDESLIPWLLGESRPDPRLEAVSAFPPREELSHSQLERMREAVRLWDPRDVPSPVLAVAPREVGAPAVETALRVCEERVGPGVLAVAAEALPTAADELDLVVRLVARRARLEDAAVLLLLAEGEASAAARFIERLDAPLAVAGRAPAGRRPAVAVEVAKPTRVEQRGAWSQVLPHHPGAAAGLAWRYDLAVSAITAAGAEIGDAPDRAGAAAAAARRRARPQLDGLARRVASTAGWDDLVLPETQLRSLRMMVAQLAHRGTVYDDWGYADAGDRGLGSTVLFTGASGVGKTTAAEVVARELGMDLYRVDLSATVSKYIGETEKHLRRLFDAAEEGGALLLFDEADALFSKRTEVKDSHDRNANLEVSYLLQRLETFKGLAILTTNMRQSIDSAFLRRLRFVVAFPFPDEVRRALIWARAIPAGRQEGLDLGRLAQLALSGGQIRAVSLNAAFMAADAKDRLRMEHLLACVLMEYDKQGKVPSPAELRALSL